MARMKAGRYIRFETAAGNLTGLVLKVWRDRARVYVGEGKHQGTFFIHERRVLNRGRSPL